MNQKTIITILAVIGGLVVAGWVLKFALNLMGPLIVVGVAFAAYLILKDNKRIGGPK